MVSIERTLLAAALLFLVGGAALGYVRDEPLVQRNYQEYVDPRSLQPGDSLGDFTVQAVMLSENDGYAIQMQGERTLTARAFLGDPFDTGTQVCFIIDRDQPKPLIFIAGTDERSFCLREVVWGDFVNMVDQQAELAPLPAPIIVTIKIANPLISNVEQDTVALRELLDVDIDPRYPTIRERRRR